MKSVHAAVEKSIKNVVSKYALQVVKTGVCYGIILAEPGIQKMITSPIYPYSFHIAIIWPFITELLRTAQRLLPSQPE